VIQQRIPIRVKHSSCLMILAEAMIIEPEIQLSHDLLNFGGVMTGYRKVLTSELFSLSIGLR